MVAQQPIERPKSVDPLINRINDLQKQIDALTRRSSYPFSISHDGVADFQVIPDPDDPAGGAKVRILNGSGQAIFETFYSTLYDGKTARMLDLAGNIVWNQDELAGYGLSHPSLQGMLEPDFNGQGINVVAVGTEIAAATGDFFAYNPAFRFRALVRGGGAGTYSCRFSINYTTGTVFGPATTGLSGNNYVSSTLLLPEEAMSHQVTASLLVTNTSAAQTIQVSVLRCFGVSMAQYKLDNGLT